MDTDDLKSDAFGALDLSDVNDFRIDFLFVAHGVD